VSGTWIGYYANGVEIFRIYEDGTYVQEFYRNKQRIYVNKGRWEIGRERSTVLLRDFRTVEEFWRVYWKGVPQEERVEPIAEGASFLSSPDKALVFDDDLSYGVFKKEKGWESAVSPEVRVHLPDSILSAGEYTSPTATAHSESRSGS